MYFPSVTGRVTPHCDNSFAQCTTFTPPYNVDSPENVRGLYGVQMTFCL